MIKLLNDLEFRKSAKFLHNIIGIGILIGIASYAIGDHLNFMRTIFMKVVASLFFGYFLILLSISFSKKLTSNKALYIFLFACFLIGVFGSEFESLIHQTVIEGKPYQPLSSGGVYIFNGILCALLGNVFRSSVDIIGSPTDSESKQDNLAIDQPLELLPIKKLKKVILMPIDDVVIIEANEKYTNIKNEDGENNLCDYSISYLETKLPSNFIRVHRKYIINKMKIISIEPYDKQRYTFTFVNPKIESIKNGASYYNKVKSLIKL